MFNYITAETIASEIKMTTLTGKSVLVLEGETDKKCFVKFINRDNAEVISVAGKEKAIEAVRILNKERITNFICVVDSDFDNIIGCFNENNIIRTEYHDFEVSIIVSKAFERLSSEYCSKLPNDTIKCTEDLRKFIFARLLPVSILKYLNYINKWGLVFKGVDISDYVDKSNLQINLINYIRRVLENTKKSLSHRMITAETVDERSVYQKLFEEMVTEKMLLCEIEKHIIYSFDLYQISNGHDTVAIFSVALRKFLSCLEHSVAEAKNIEKVLRLSFDTADFISTRIYQEMKKWCTNNADILIC